MSIIDKKKTSSIQDIPVVSSQTIDALHHVYAGKKWGIHLNELKEHLIRVNPNLVKFVESQVSKNPYELHNAIFEVVLGTIEVIRLQGLLDEKQREKTSK